MTAHLEFLIRPTAPKTSNRILTIKNKQTHISEKLPKVQKNTHTTRLKHSDQLLRASPAGQNCYNPQTLS